MISVISLTNKDLFDEKLCATKTYPILVNKNIYNCRLYSMYFLVFVVLKYFCSEGKASVSRELTKIFEENKRGSLSELKTYFESKTVKGEIVIVVEGKNEK